MVFKTLFLSAALSVSPAEAGADHLVQARDNGTSNTITLEGMPYDQARLYIMAAGWEPVENADPDSRVFATGQMYDQGYSEVDTCSPVGAMPCNFDFTKDGNFLRVHTQGENPYVTGYELTETNPRPHFVNNIGSPFRSP